MLGYENNERKVNLKQTTHSWETLIKYKIENEMSTPSNAFYTFGKNSGKSKLLDDKEAVGQEIKIDC